MGIATGVGVTAGAGKDPIAFVLSVKNELWVNRWRNEAWDWTNLGSVPCKSPVGVTIVDSWRPYAFLDGTDGSLLMNWSSGSDSTWSYQGRTPTNASVRAGAGAITLHDTEDSRPYAFMICSDGNLWTNWWDGGSWQWANLGRPSFKGDLVAGAGAIAVEDVRPYVFVIGSDGHLWLDWWDGDKTWTWADQGRPSPLVGVTGSVGAVSLGEWPYAFVLGSDGNLWLNSWNGKVWTWSSQGKPGAGIAAAVGVILVEDDRPYAFVRGSDGNLWVNWWDETKKTWQWDNLGRPTVGISGSVGAVTINGERPYVFVIGADYHLWVLWWDGDVWHWSDHGTAK